MEQISSYNASTYRASTGGARNIERVAPARGFRPAVVPMGSGANSTFSLLGSLALLNILGGIAVAVAASYGGEVGRMLTFVFGVEVAIALLAFVVALRTLRQ